MSRAPDALFIAPSWAYRLVPATSVEIPSGRGLEAPPDVNVQECAAGQYRQMAGWMC
jgi:hypothetical protein